MTRENEKHNELLALYQVTNKEISRFKSLPWRLNIVIAILTAALVVIISDFRANPCPNCNLLLLVFVAIIISLLLTFFACYTAGYCFDKVQEKRKVLSKIYRKFGADFNEAIDNQDPQTLDFGDTISLIITIVFPIASMSILLIVCML